jgi:Common central domain of tyrosinase/Polyphenol oxidase middle domain
MLMLLPRRWSLLFLFASFLVLLAACPGGGPDTPDDGTTTDGTTTDGPVTTDLPTSDIPGQQVFVRPNIGKLDPNGPQIAAFRQGVQVMKSRPASDPTSWLYQANIHGTDDAGDLQAWNTCQHGSFFFLSWHRMYLYYFERILRKASGDPNFALPFWDYSDPTQRAIPVALRQPAGAQNSLFITQRAPGINQGAQLPESATTFDDAMDFTNFASPAGSPLSFGGAQVPGPVHFNGVFGALESQPHNIVHVLVGGNNGFMIDPNLAARDPVFWLHHANIDRLWNVWLAREGGRTNPTMGNWPTQVFTFFDENGQAVQLTGQQVVDSAQQLNYRYAEGRGDEPTPQGIEPSLPAAPFTDSKQRVLADKAVNARLRGARGSVAVTIPPGPEVLGRHTLVLEGIRFGRPGVYYEVYAGLPPGAQPDSKGPHYVGNIAIFGQRADGTSAHAGHAGRALQEDAKLAYDIEPLIERLRKQPGFTGDLKLDFVPKGLEGVAVPEVAVREVRVARVKIVVE